MTSKLPVVFVPHGGGPMSYVEFGAPRAEVDALAEYWRKVGQLPRVTPRALLVVSAHWEAEVPTLMTSPNPPMLYDYYGFPPAAYEIRWPAPGAPWLAGRVRELLGQADIPSAVDEHRGFDHGTFVPLGRIFPNAEIPTLQLSLASGLDPSLHLAIGRALTPLRDEGVFIIGSGMSYHNMRGFGAPQADADAAAFDAWLQETIRLPSAERDERLAAWEHAPSARRVHPHEEHLLPLMVVAGAAGDDRGSVPYSGKVFGKAISAAQFG
ncbi:MAG TPA: class III extradiol ring-cleavage dioxygenase [Polyangiaceae bacterium]|nr:class III extradiol ring-cleavage dioxygenase [Polyangiaceae bacterium]